MSVRFRSVRSNIRSSRTPHLLKLTGKFFYTQTNNISISHKSPRTSIYYQSWIGIANQQRCRPATRMQMLGAGG